MPLKTPKFWYEKRSRIANLLTPLSVIYLTGQNFHQYLNSLKKPYKASVPVICLGNVTMGGSGKTPTALALYDLVIKHGIAKKPVFLTRGYGGDCVNATEVDLTKHTFKEVGDEPILLAKKGTVIASVVRPQGAKLAEKLGADLIIMDDGFQNQSIHKDVNFIVADKNNPFGNGLAFPAGPLREPIGKAIKRAQAFISIGGSTNMPVNEFEAIIEPTDKSHDKTKNYIAFAGLARPEKFKMTLDKLGYNVISWYDFPDHHPYTDKEIQNALDEAKQKNALVITTEKDLVRIKPALRESILSLPIELKFKDEEGFISFLKDQLK